MVQRRPCTISLKCHSDACVFQDVLESLDRKANRVRSERGKRMMVKREEGGFVANSHHCYPKSAPAWTLSADLQG